MADIEDLKRRIEAEARRAEFSIDEVPYKKAGRDPQALILFAGSLDSKLAFFARDLGWNEVIEGEPLIGDAGQRVRKAIYRAVFGNEPPPGDTHLAEAVSRVLLTNTVPYKPVGNKAYSTGVKERFRPFVAELLTCYWQGETIITMGTEAFQWFKPYAEKGAVEAFWKRPDRFEASMEVTLSAECGGKTVSRTVTLAPLPHPSPLNQAYLALFPSLLEARLNRFLVGGRVG
jgi:uracil-DNA glycosylase